MSVISSNDYISSTLHDYDFSKKKLMDGDELYRLILVVSRLVSFIFMPWKIGTSIAMMVNQIRKSVPITIASRVSLAAFGLSGLFSIALFFGCEFLNNKLMNEKQKEVKDLNILVLKILEEIKINKEIISKLPLLPSCKSNILNVEKSMVQISGDLKSLENEKGLHKINYAYDRSLNAIKSNQMIVGTYYKNGKFKMEFLEKIT
ncbi:MAG: hypothetical protein H0W88_05890 [Parachlamydiaceae bacterium]|nr:hypothetical protein [Parachlamydiaceae bacterium]